MSVLVLVLLGCGEPTAPAQPLPWEGVRLHLTIDDAVYQRSQQGAPLPDAATVGALHADLLSHLEAREVSASVFVNCGTLREPAAELAPWVRAGHVVGNHTSGHLRLSDVGHEVWLEDVGACHRVLSAALPEPPRWFRYPYLDRGETAEMTQAAATGLGELGYRTAPVTVATAEWVHAFAYREAAGDQAAQRVIGDDYVRHMVDAVQAGREMATALTDREVAHIVLLHLNELNGAMLDDVLTAWAERGARFVDLHTAMADPIYAADNRYVGRGGISWLARVAPDELLGERYWFGREEGRLLERWPVSY